MSDDLEDQQMELEALEAIFDTQFSKISSNSFLLTLDLFDISCQYPKKYPNEIPIINIINSKNHPNEIIDSLAPFIEQICIQNLSMAMVFTLVEATQEELLMRLEDRERRIREIDEARIAEIEKIEQEKFLGSRVTTDAFSAWNEKFLEEIRLKESENIDQKMIEMKKSRLSGRQLFEKDISLVTSDIKFRSDGDDEVEVDLTLFHDQLDGLDLSDSDDENQFIRKNFTEDDE